MNLSQLSLFFKGINLPKLMRQRKVFCIGHNKTGTTSLEAVFKEFGYAVGSQPEAEMLLKDWAVRDFRRIIEYCKTAEAFQDVPFSLDYTYQTLDQVFPGSKFILTVRDSADEWYESLVRFHSKIMNLSYRPPTVDDVKNFSYRYPSWFWQAHQYIYGVDETTLYDKKIYTEYYLSHNRQIEEYFRYRPNDLLVLNLSETSAMQRLCKFLGIEFTGQQMPHLNQSRS